MHGISLRTCSLAFAGSLALSASAIAQSIPLTPVDQNVSDVSPLQTSLIFLEPDHGWASGFERVYESPLFPDKFIRIHGAVWALFPKSEYVESDDGMLPVIPAATEFFIGPPPLPSVSPTIDAPPSNYVSLLAPSRRLDADTARASRSAPAPIVLRVSPATPTRLTVWSSSEYRSRRLDAILRLARESDSR